MAEAPAALSDFPYRIDIPTRWGDNDMLGHLNNVVYNRCIEDIVTKFTRLELGVDWLGDACYPVSVETVCRFHQQLSWPETVAAGLRIERLGESSVAYGIGLFGADRTAPAATGRFVHVYIDRQSQRPVRVPDGVRARLKDFQSADAAE